MCITDFRYDYLSEIFFVDNTFLLDDCWKSTTVSNETIIRFKIKFIPVTSELRQAY